MTCQIFLSAKVFLDCILYEYTFSMLCLKKLTTTWAKCVLVWTRYRFKKLKNELKRRDSTWINFMLFWTNSKQFKNATKKSYEKFPNKINWSKTSIFGATQMGDSFLEIAKLYGLDISNWCNIVRHSRFYKLPKIKGTSMQKMDDDFIDMLFPPFEEDEFLPFFKLFWW